MKLSKMYAESYLNFLMGKVSSLAAPKQVWAGLCTNDPEESDTFTEVTGNGYGRILLSINGADYPADIGDAADRAIANVKQLVFPKATGAYSVFGIGLFTAESPTSNPAPFAYGKLNRTEALSIPEGALPMFEVNGFSIDIPG